MSPRTFGIWENLKCLLFSVPPKNPTLPSHRGRWKQVNPANRALVKPGRPIPCLVDSTDYRNIDKKPKGRNSGGGRLFSEKKNDAAVVFGEINMSFWVQKKDFR